MTWTMWTPFDGWDPLFEPRRGLHSFGWLPLLPPRVEAARRPRFELRPTEEGLELEASLPGADAQSIELSVEGRELSVRVQIPERDAHANWLLRERARGRFEQRYELPFEPKPEGVQAEYKRGLLKIRVPRAASESPRRIPIRVAS